MTTNTPLPPPSASSEPVSPPAARSEERHLQLTSAPVEDALRALLTGFLQGLESALRALINPARMAPEQALYFFAERQLASNQAAIVEGALARLADFGPLHLAPGLQQAAATSPSAGTADLIDRACDAVRTTMGTGITTHLVVHGMALQTLLLDDEPYWSELTSGALHHAFHGSVSNLNTDSRTVLLLVRLFETLVLDGLEALPPADQRDHLDEALNLLPIGTWVRYLLPERDALVCRLQIADITDQRLIFVNQSGFEVLGVPASRIDAALRSGVLKIMTEADLLQRALQAMQPSRIPELD